MNAYICMKKDIILLESQFFICADFAQCMDDYNIFSNFVEIVGKGHP